MQTVACAPAHPSIGRAHQRQRSALTQDEETCKRPVSGTVVRTTAEGGTGSWPDWRRKKALPERRKTFGWGEVRGKAWKQRHGRCVLGIPGSQWESESVGKLLSREHLLCQ